MDEREYTTVTEFVVNDLPTKLVSYLGDIGCQDYLLNYIALDRLVRDAAILSGAFYEKLVISPAMNLTMPKERKIDFKFFKELPEHPIYTLSPDIETTFTNSIRFIKNMLYYKKLFMADIGDWIDICKSKAEESKRYIFINVNPISPYFEMFIEVFNGEPNYVAHSYDTFMQYWLESSCHEIDGPTRQITSLYAKILKTHDADTIVETVSARNVAKLNKSCALYKQIKTAMGYVEDITIVGTTTGLYYVFSIIDASTRPQSACSIYSLLTRTVCSYGYGYYIEFPIISWEQTYSQVRKLLVQYGDSSSLFSTAKKYCYTDTALTSLINSKIFDYSQLYGISHHYTEIIAYCDMCYACIYKDATWKKCMVCKNYDICPECCTKSHIEFAHCILCDIYYDGMKTVTYDDVTSRRYTPLKTQNPVY